MSLFTLQYDIQYYDIPTNSKVNNYSSDKRYKIKYYFAVRLNCQNALEKTTARIKLMICQDLRVHLNIRIYIDIL